MDNDRSRKTTALVTGLTLAGTAVFCALSLFSHVSSDVLDFQGGGTGQVCNWGGRVGARAAHHLVCLYGVGAWVLVLSLLVFGALLAATRSFSGLFLRGAGAALLLALVCAWAGTFAPPQGRLGAPDVFANYNPAGWGGLLGNRYLAPPLVEYFGPVGVYLVLVTAGLLAGLMLAQEATEFLLALAGRGTVRLCGLAWEALALRLRGGLPGTSPALSPAVASAGHAAGVSLAGPPWKETETLAPAGPGAGQNDRLAIAERLVTRRVQGPQVDLPARSSPDEKPAAPEARERCLPKLEPPNEARKDAGEASAAAEAETARQRREEATRQAEAAEQTRLQREKEAREQGAREAKLLEKLEKERAAQEREKGKARAKFVAAMSGKEPTKTLPALGAPEKANAGPEEAATLPTFKPPAQLPDDYKLPDLLSMEAQDITVQVSSEALKERGIKLIETLWEFKIGSRLVDIQHGPAVTMYELSLDPGIKVQRVISLSDNLSMAMKAEHGVRIIAPLPGRDTIGIEIPNNEDYVVRMRPILESTAFRAGHWTLPLVLGRDATGNPLVTDLARMPHLLIAGTTGSGKSVCVNAIILSLMILRRPHEVKLILVDPKQVEMSDFKGIPHLLSPVVSDMKLAAGVLTWAVQKMEERYERMSKVGVRNIATFNRLTREQRLERLPVDEPQEPYIDPLPYIVIVVDEFADLMMSSGKEIEQAIARLAQKARAAGIHVILATQRPSADVLTGLIKTNLPCRISFQVKSKVDSRIVLDSGGAEKLAGKGDLLFVPPGSSQLIRAKGVYVADHEIKAVVDFCKGQAAPVYTDEIEKAAHTLALGEEGGEEAGEPMPMDEKFEEGVECFLALGRASTSLLQRRMGLGYTRAAKLCDQMEARGIVGPDRGAKGRELLITQEAWDSFKKGKLADSNHEATWGDRKPAAPETSTPSGLVPTLACLDNIDGTRAGPADLEKKDEAAEEVNAELVGALDDASAKEPEELRPA